MSITAAECRAARVAAGKTQTELSKLAGVGSRTVMDFERGARVPIPATVEAIRRALEGLGAEFRPGGWVKLPKEQPDLFEEEAAPES